MIDHLSADLDQCELINGRENSLSVLTSGYWRRFTAAITVVLAAACILAMPLTVLPVFADEPATKPAKSTGDAVELDMKDRVNLGIKAEAGACFAPDGKNILFASLSEVKEKKDTDKNAEAEDNELDENGNVNVKRLITYSRLSLDGKDRKELCKLITYADFNRYYSRTNFPGLFPDRAGNISPDCKFFIASLSSESPKKHKGLPFQLCDIDGKVTELPWPAAIESDSAVQGMALPGGTVICGVFGDDGTLYCVWPDSGGRGALCSFDLKTNSGKVYATSSSSLTTRPLSPIAISPDRTKIAGMGSNVDNNAWFVWVFDIKAGKFDISGTLSLQGQQVNVLLQDYAYAPQNIAMPQLVWSQDNSIVYASHFTGGLYSFKPFVKPVPLTRQEIDKYKAIIANLGDEDYQQRDAAEVELRAGGEKIAEVLKTAIASEDPEIAKRAQAIFEDTCARKPEMIFDRKIVVSSFVEISPGYLFVKTLDSSMAMIVNVAAGKNQRLRNLDNLILIDKAGDLGLFRSAKDNTLWTAKIDFRTGLVASANSARKNPGGLDNPVPVQHMDKITMDGDLGEWKDVKPLPLPFMNKNAGSIKLAWTKDGLYGSASVEKKEIKVDQQNPWTADCIEIFLEKDISFIVKNIDGACTEQDQANAFQAVFAPGDGDSGEGFSNLIWGLGRGGQNAAATGFTCSWKKTDKGYDIEFCISADTLNPAAMKEGTKLGINLALNKDGKPTEQFYCDKNTDQAYRRPLLWGTIILGK